MIDKSMMASISVCSGLSGRVCSVVRGQDSASVPHGPSSAASASPGGDAGGPVECECGRDPARCSSLLVVHQE
jgi:hypothetical protein